MNANLAAVEAPLKRMPLGLPLLEFIRNDPLGAASCFQREYGDVATLDILFRRICYLFDPEAARELLVDHHDDVAKEARLLGMFQTFQGRNVFSIEGTDWVRQRRILTPGFSARKMVGYLGLMDAAIDACIRSDLPADVGASTDIDVGTLTTRITMDVILRTLFSHAASREEAAAISLVVRALSRQSMREAYWPIVAQDWLPFPGRATKRQHLATMNALVDRHVDARLDAPAHAEPRQDLLDMMLAARDEQPGAAQATLTLDEVRANCHILFGAGFDTAASALTWWLGLMAVNPNVVQRLREELTAAGPNATAETLVRLPWLNATLKEAMRLYPPSTALITRVAQRDLALRDGSVRIAKGTLVIVPIWHLHHDARSFPEPTQFRPERFMPGAQGFPRGAYLPFGAGPHVCLGQQFAMIEMALVAARLISAFDVTLADETHWPEAIVDLALKPKTPMRLRFTRRTDVRVLKH